MTSTLEQGVQIAEAATRQIFKNAQDIIDKEFGNGYASKNPQLLSAVVLTQGNIYTGFIDAKNNQ